MATNEILPFAATDTGTNLLTQAEYVADSQRPVGNQPGIARSKLVNKAMKQAAIMSAGLGQFIADKQSNNVTDLLTQAQIAEYLAVAVRNSAFPSGTRLIFPQAAAPVGWTQVTDANLDNRMMRIVTQGGSGAGGAVGGSNSPIINDVVPSHTHSFTTGGQSAGHFHGFAGTTSWQGAHSHSLNDPGHIHTVASVDDQGQGGGTTISNNNWAPDQNTPTSHSYTGISVNGVGDHAHTINGNTGVQSADHTHSGTTNGNGSASNWTPRYLNNIICSKD